MHVVHEDSLYHYMTVQSNFYLLRVKLNYASTAYQGLVDWNNLLKSQQDIKSLSLFNQALKKVVFANFFGFFLTHTFFVL